MNSSDESKNSHLFVYGTLKDPSIRYKITGKNISVFRQDILTGYKMSTVSEGGYTYPIIIADDKSMLEITGEVLEVSEDDLIKLDNYEGDLYIRKEIILKSGIKAWVYSKN